LGASRSTVESKMEKCRLTGSDLELVIDLGSQPLGNGFLNSSDSHTEYFFQLQCGFSEDSSLLQLITQPEPELMFHDSYAFFSSTSKGMQEHFSKVAEQIISQYSLKPEKDFIVEVGCNDGIFLKFFNEKKYKHVGIEPSGEVARIAQSKGINVINKFFDSKVAEALTSKHGKAKLIYAANVFCHIPEIRELLISIDILLDKNGLVIFEDPYLGDIVEKTSYDQIYDEHVYFFSALAVENIFKQINMELVDCEPILVHGGSMRYTLGRKGEHSVKRSVEKIKNQEMSQGLHLSRTFHTLSKKIAQSKIDLRSELAKLNANGIGVCAYGATSKSTTIYNYCGITPELVDVIFDNSPLKIGKLSPGMHIPIVDEKEFLSSKREIAFLGAWNHREEILRRNTEFTNRGGKWLTHVPSVSYL
jgi:2-polyprenyl-3-methyl-5-hydroxy-6-metoxy-1,4-benzoquinol methylase